MKFTCFLTLLVFSSILSSCVVNEPATPAPTAGFSFTGDNQFSPCKVKFTDASLNAVSYQWNFGDGQASTEKSPEHLYKQGGTYTVILTVLNESGQNAILTKQITVLDPPSVLSISNLTITLLPAVKTNGGGWDSNNGPDVFFRIFDSAGKEVFKSEKINDVVLPSGLPIKYTTGFPTFLAPDNYTFAFYDYDDFPFTDDDISNGKFDLSTLIPKDGSAYPTKQDYEITGANVKFSLEFTWE